MAPGVLPTVFVAMQEGNRESRNIRPRYRSAVSMTAPSCNWPGLFEPEGQRAVLAYRTFYCCDHAVPFYWKDKRNRISTTVFDTRGDWRFHRHRVVCCAAEGEELVNARR